MSYNLYTYNNLRQVKDGKYQEIRNFRLPTLLETREVLISDLKQSKTYELCQNHSDLRQKYSELGKNMPLFHKTTQKYTFSRTVEWCIDNQRIL